LETRKEARIEHFVAFLAYIQYVENVNYLANSKLLSRNVKCILELQFPVILLAKYFKFENLFARMDLSFRSNGSGNLKSHFVENEIGMM